MMARELLRAASLIACIPHVQDKATLQDRLETAINNAEGFGLR